MYSRYRRVTRATSGWPLSLARTSSRRRVPQGHRRGLARVDSCVSNEGVQNAEAPHKNLVTTEPSTIYEVRHREFTAPLGRITDHLVALISCRPLNPGRTRRAIRLLCVC